jgi:hypothetical protein
VLGLGGGRGGGLCELGLEGWLRRGSELERGLELRQSSTQLADIGSREDDVGLLGDQLLELGGGEVRMLLEEGQELWGELMWSLGAPFGGDECTGTASGVALLNAPDGVAMEVEGISDLDLGGEAGVADLGHGEVEAGAIIEAEDEEREVAEEGGCLALAVD